MFLKLDIYTEVNPCYAMLHELGIDFYIIYVYII